VTKEELLRRVNEIATSMGLPPVSKRGLSDWIDEGLIRGARPIGRRRGLNPRWEYDEDDVDRGRVLLGSRMLGARRVAELRLYLWARGYEVSAKKVKLALTSEFRRQMKSQRRKAVFQYDHRQSPNLSDRELAIYSKRLGPLDPRLAALGLDLSPKSMLDMASRLTWGLDEHEHIAAGVQQLFPPGLLGAPDETERSGEELSGLLAEVDLEEARVRNFEFMAQLVTVPLCLAIWGVPFESEFSQAFDLAAKSMLRPEWLVRNLASFAISAYRLRMRINKEA